METTTTPPPMAEGAVNLTAPVQSVTAPAQPITAPVVMENGGQTTSSDSSFFKNINWLQIGFMILGSAALLSVIFRNKIYMEKTKLENERLGKLIDEVKMNVQTQMKGKYKEIV